MWREVARKSRSEAGRVDDGESGCEGVTEAFSVGWATDACALEEGVLDARGAGFFAAMWGAVAECSCSVSSRRFVAVVS
jgi:hypothetical protein